MRKIGYARVSSSHQDLERQLGALRAERVHAIFREKASAKSIKGRPELEKAIDELGSGDVLVLAEWDRSTRSMFDGITCTSQGDRACRSAELGRWVAKRLPRLPRSPNRSAQIRKIGVAGLNLGCAITPPLDGNSAGAHPIAPGIEQAAARGGYPYHEGTAGRYSCPGDSARHDNARRIRSAPAARSTRPRGSPWTSTPPSPP